MMNGNTGTVLTGQSKTFCSKQNTVTGQMYNCSCQHSGAYGGHLTGHSMQSLDSYTGYINTYNYHTY